MMKMNLLYNHAKVRKLRAIWHRELGSTGYFVHHVILQAYMTEYEAKRLLRKLDPTMNPDSYYQEAYSHRQKNTDKVEL